MTLKISMVIGSRLLGGRKGEPVLYPAVDVAAEDS